MQKVFFETTKLDLMRGFVTLRNGVGFPHGLQQTLNQLSPPRTKSIDRLTICEK